MLGADRSAGDAVWSFDLVPEGLDEWLRHAEAQAWNAGGGKRADLPEEWKGFHTDALEQLMSAAHAARELRNAERQVTPEDQARLSELLELTGRVTQ